MANSRTYIDEMKLTLCCLDIPIKEAEEIMRKERASRALRAQIMYYRDNPKERNAFMRNYNTLRMERYKNEEADRTKTLSEMEDEQYVRACLRFLEKANDEEDDIPGYAGHGPQAGRELLQTGA